MVPFFKKHQMFDKTYKEKQHLFKLKDIGCLRNIRCLNMRNEIDKSLRTLFGLILFT